MTGSTSTWVSLVSPSTPQTLKPSRRRRQRVLPAEAPGALLREGKGGIQTEAGSDGQRKRLRERPRGAHRRPGTSDSSPLEEPTSRASRLRFRTLRPRMPLKKTVDRRVDELVSGFYSTCRRFGWPSTYSRWVRVNNRLTLLFILFLHASSFILEYAGRVMCPYYCLSGC
jgi:hypothetical protein